MTARVVHGGVSDAERAAMAASGLAIIDLSANINPYGPHPRVARAARLAPIDRYPDPAAAPLRAAYAAEAGLDPCQVIAGNGSSELIYLALHAFAAPGRPVLVAGPTFGEYAAAASAAGAAIVRWDASPPAFEPGVDALAGAIRRQRPGVTVVCNPNNPTGALIPAAGIDVLTAAVLAAGGCLLVDEAYVEFGAPGSSVGPSDGRLVVRSLTKMHAIPGLRAGILLGAAGDIAAVARLQPPWPVSAPAIAASLQALRERRFAATSRARLRRALSSLVTGLATAGFETVPTDANFVLVRVGDAPAFRGRLLARGFVVRDCTSFGLPEYVRVAAPREELVVPLLDAMEGSR